MDNKIILLVLVFILFNINVVMSAPPFISDTSFTNGYALKAPFDNVLKVNEPIEFEIHVYNISNGRPTVSGVGCYMHLYNSSGGHALELFDNTASHNFDYTFLVNASFITPKIEYVLFQCNDSGTGGFVVEQLIVTYTGRDNPEPIVFVFFYILLFALFFVYFFYATNVIVYFLNLKWIDGKPNNMFYLKDFLFNFGGYLALLFFFYIYNYYIALPLVVQVLTYMLYISVLTNLFLSVIAIMISIIYYGLNSILDSVGVKNGKSKMH